MRERVILHSDLNNFFASVETVLHPEYAGKPLIVCGDPKERRGVVLAKSNEAKSYGIKTAETVVSALRKCPQLLMSPPHFKEYNRYSAAVTDIYARFTDRIEQCSIDECALDVTESVKLFGSGEEIAEKIRKTVREETGLTVSIGVSFNKVYAKLASDMKKPDAVTVISRENYKQRVYPLPATDLLFVGRSTADVLSAYGIKTIGDIAEADEALLIRILGKRGRQVRIYARGEDSEPVRKADEKEEIKSIGNSMTLPRDVSDREELKRLLYVLSESVAARLRESDAGKCDTVHIWIRDENFKESGRQKRVPPTELCGDIAKAAYELLCAHCPPNTALHAIGVSVSGFDHHIEQLRLDGGENGGYDKRKRAEDAVAGIRKKYGYEKLQRGIVLEDAELAGLDIKGKKE
ncbi:MAG: DNA polymerase IV [Clostridia bacterium]|nr:DNA polymerase IV [Clostridia bacterium]